MAKKGYDIIFGQTEDGRGVVIFLGQITPSARMKKFLEVCEGVIKVEMVTTPMGLGIMERAGAPEELYFEAGEFMPNGLIKKKSSAIEISAYAHA